MNKIVGLILLVVGAILLYFSYEASQSLASEASQGAATSYFEQYAQTATVDTGKIGMAAFHEAVATPGAAGGMIITSGAYGVGKGIKIELQKI